MRTLFIPLASALASLALVPVAAAQTGNVDQHSLRGVFDDWLNWAGGGSKVQQQVTAGATGQLTGVEVMIRGLPGQVVAVRVRPGGVLTGAYNTQPALWEGLAVKATNSEYEMPLLDTTAAGIALVEGQVFTLELQIMTGAVGTGFGAVNETPPCYPDPSWPTPPAMPNARVVFRTFLDIPAPGTNYCPPAMSSVGVLVRMWAEGTTSIAADDLTFVAAPMPDAPALFYYGTQTMQLPFGNGFACVAGLLGRLPGAMPHCGTLITPFELALVPPQVVAPGTTLYAQCWFRDPYGGGGPAEFGFSEAYAFTLTP